MILTKCGLICAITLTGAITYSSGQSASEPLKRTVLQRADVSVPGREGMSVLVEFAGGASTGRHTHAGEEIDYVLSGEGELVVDGQPTKALKAGDASIIPGGVVHDTRNTGTQPLRVVAVFVVEKGKPLTTPAN
jgi:quercetin dioxygenase-like cupin family protein